jgi:hypothetical protein
MKHLPFPFEESAILLINNGETKKTADCELATSDIEIFQSILYRKKLEKPLILKFATDRLQSFSLQGYKFDIEQICITPETFIVKSATTLKKRKDEGRFIQGYSEFAFVILAPIGFIKKYKVQTDKTKIKL